MNTGFPRANAFCCAFVIFCLAFVGDVLACSQPQPPRPPANPPPPPPRCFKLIDGLDGQGRTRIFVWCEIKRIFNTTTPHNCACGKGISSVGLPGDTVAVAAQVGVFDIPSQTMVSTIPQFDALARNPASDAAFAAGPGPGQMNPSLPQLGPPGAQPFPGQTWFGFGGVIQPVTAPFGENGENLPANRIYVLCFEFRTLNPAGFMTALTNAQQDAAGLGNPDNTPLFDQLNDHSATYSTPQGTLVPEPMAASIIGLGGVLALRRRR